MAVNEQTAAPNFSRQRQKRLKLIGVSVLLLGLASVGAVYWTGTHAAGLSEDKLLPGNAKAESHQMQLLYGKLGLLTMELSDDLKQPGTQAAIIATVSILIAAGCFYLARLPDDGDERESS